MDVARLNINVGGHSSTGFDGPEEVFTELEKLVGGPLPASYKELMRYADGGHPEVGSCPLPNEKGMAELFDVDCLYALASSNVERVVDVHAVWAQILGAGALPLGRDGGGNQIYVALRDAPSSVWLYLHEGGRRVRLAHDLEGFIASLVSNPDFI